MSSIKLLRPLSFTVEQSRDDIIKSILNNSKSKSSWTFSKQKRFKDVRQSQLNNDSTVSNKQQQIHQLSDFSIKNHSYGFGKSKRRVFTEVSQTPFPWRYNPEQPKSKWKNMVFGQARQKCKNSSYINKQQQQIPGPNRYQIKSTQKNIRFTMRPKTGHERTYFIENKQAMQVPGPGKYNQDIETVARKSFTSKFRDSSLGSSTIMSKTKRFRTESDKKIILSTSLYDKLKASWAKGCRIGSQKRLSFVQTSAKLHDAPGPGNYQLPSQFGHYKKL